MSRPTSCRPAANWASASWPTRRWAAGFLTATIKSVDALIAKDRRREHPRFLPENINKNNELLKSLETIATAHQAHAGAGGAGLAAGPGARTSCRSRAPSGASYLEQNCAAAELQLSAGEIARLSAAFPPGVTAGTRYPEKQLKALGI